MPSPADRPDQYVTRLQATYEAIVAHKTAHDGNCPTRRELGAQLGLSSGMVHFYLKRLVLAGLLEWDGESTRNFRVVGARWQPPAKSAQDVLKAVRSVSRVDRPVRTRPSGTGQLLTVDE